MKDQEAFDARFSDGLHFKLIEPHHPECWYPNDPEAFICEDGIDWWRDKIGRRGGSTMWYRFRCNDPKCEAVKIVRFDALARFVTGGDS